MTSVHSKPVSVPLRVLLAALATLSLASCDEVKPDKSRAEELEFYDFSSDIRWSDFNSAYDFVDPDTKKEHPLSDMEAERFKQVEVSGYEVMSKVEGDGTIDQQVKLGLVNRNTQIPRTIVYREHWRWDADHKYWWLASGLPDITPQD